MNLFLDKIQIPYFLNQIFHYPYRYTEKSGKFDLAFFSFQGKVF